MVADRLRRVLLGGAGVALVLGALETASRTGVLDRTEVPPATEILARAVGMMGDGEFGGHLGATVEAWLSGVLLAVAFAVPAGLVLGSVPLLDRAALIVVELLRPIPSVALIPLAILVFAEPGRVERSLVCYACLWPILLNTLYGLREVEPLAKETLRSFGFGPLSVLARVSLPSAAPFVLTGIRIALAVGLVVAVSAELRAGGESGLGIYLLATQSGGGRPDLMLAGALWAGVLGLMANALVVGVERRAFRWTTR